MNGYYESACMHAHTCLYVHVHAHTHACIHTHTIIHTHTAYTHKCMHEYTHTCMHKHTHTYTHMYMQLLWQKQFQETTNRDCKEYTILEYWELKELLSKAWSNRFKILHWVPNVGFIIKCFGWTIKSKSKDTI